MGSKITNFFVNVLTFKSGYRWVGSLGVICLAIVPFVFQNCSTTNVLYAEGSRAGERMLMFSSVFGSDALVTPETNQHLVHGIDNRGMPVVEFQAVPVNLNNPRLGQLTENWGLDAGTDVATGDHVICPKITDITPDSCEESYTFVAGHCIPKCPSGKIYASGECYTRTENCIVQGGSGRQHWASNSFGRCVATTCDASQGYDLINQECIFKCKEGEAFISGQCVPQAKNCIVEGGTGMQKMVGSETSIKYGKCVAICCHGSFKLSGDKCVPKCKSTEVYFNGQCKPKTVTCKSTSSSSTSGYILWEDDGYGDCKVETCPEGQNPNGNKCVPICPKTQAFYDGKCFPTTEPCPITNGSGHRTWVGAKYNPKCDVISCDKGFEKMGNRCITDCPGVEVYANGKCIPPTKPCPITGGSGSQTWNGTAYGRCIVTTCNSGLIQSGNNCQPPPVNNPPVGGDGDGGDGDPLIVDLGNKAERISLTSQLKGILYDLLGMNAQPNAHNKVLISWTTNPRYRWLALPNANGEITGINQLFGDNTKGPDGLGASDGFAALLKYDGTDADGQGSVSQPDGFIDANDPIYHKLVLWADMNGDGVAQKSEYNGLQEMGLKTINLNYDGNFYEVDKWGNKTTFKSLVTFKDGRESLIFDLWFRFYQPVGPGCYKVKK